MDDKYTFDSLDKVINEIAEESFSTSWDVRKMWRSRYAYDFKRLKKLYKNANTLDDQLKVLWDTKTVLMNARREISNIEESYARNIGAVFAQIASMFAVSFFLISASLIVPGTLVYGTYTSVMYTIGLKRGSFATIGRSEHSHTKNIPNQKGMGNMTKQQLINKLNSEIDKVDDKIRYVTAGKLLTMNEAVVKTVDKYGEGLIKTVIDSTNKMHGGDTPGTINQQYLDAMGFKKKPAGGGKPGKPGGPGGPSGGPGGSGGGSGSGGPI